MGSSSSTSCSEGLGGETRVVMLEGQGLQEGPQPSFPRSLGRLDWLCWAPGSSSWEGPRGGEAVGQGRALPLFSQDAHGEGCQRSHCLHFFRVGAWHPERPGVWTGSQALHAAPVFTWGKRPSQKGLGKQAPPPCHAMHPRLTEGWTSRAKGLTAVGVSVWGQCSHLPLPST